jgi:hypothetical protein
MKTKNILLAVAAFAAFTSVQAGTVEPVTVTAEEFSTPSIVVETGYSSESVWRGADLGRDEASAVVTTTTELPIGVGLDLVAGYSNADTEVKDEETDLSAVFSKEIADYLVRVHVPFAQAHEAAGKCVTICETSGRQLHQLTDEEFASVHPELKGNVREVLTVHGALESRTTFGGTSPA